MKKILTVFMMLLCTVSISTILLSKEVNKMAIKQIDGKFVRVVSSIQFTVKDSAGAVNTFDSGEYIFENKTGKIDITDNSAVLVTGISDYYEKKNNEKFGFTILTTLQNGKINNSGTGNFEVLADILCVFRSGVSSDTRTIYVCNDSYTSQYNFRTLPAGNLVIQEDVCYLPKGKYKCGNGGSNDVDLQIIASSDKTKTTFAQLITRP